MTLSLSTVHATYRPRREAPTLMAYYTVWSQRRALATLDAARLQDIGISKVDAAREAARPFWDLPC